MTNNKNLSEKIVHLLIAYVDSKQHVFRKL